MQSRPRERAGERAGPIRLLPPPHPLKTGTPVQRRVRLNGALITPPPPPPPTTTPPPLPLAFMPGSTPAPYLSDFTRLGAAVAVLTDRCHFQSQPPHIVFSPAQHSGPTFLPVQLFF
ncbi:hypothetical protein SKAU_G00180860 [Synaphobranchus kaupii]|uniref:Uncharacterized protein n=1 Tax=Synaphobranchus kaupii TaxID=118154 RepID=A0A9Q1J0Q8_SYNKA|nr:hypothetical protein SKAU_G00180860 [Synaphobranchus kaupii]